MFDKTNWYKAIVFIYVEILIITRFKLFEMYIKITRMLKKTPKAT